MGDLREKFSRGVAVVLPHLPDSLNLLFGKKRGLRIKYGIDPTTPELHLGYLAVFRKLRMLQEYGHTVVLLIGDFTARFGDPTDRRTIRKLRSADEVRRTAERYEGEIRKFLDPKHLEVRRNSEWYDAMSGEELLRLMSEVTVAQMLEREMFQKRKDRGQPIGLHELVYPVLQGYDSVKIHSDVTVVGQDQVFNENVGRILQERYGQKPQLIVGLKILPGIDGKEKMSQSLGNAIALSASAEEQFGKLMAIPDDVVETYAELLTDLDMLVVRERMERGGVSARNEKGEVAKAIVSQLYGDEHAAIAAAMFEKRFSKKELPHDLTCHEVPYGRRKIIDLLVDVRFVKSRSEARRVIEQGGVEINGKRMKDPKGEIEIPQTNEGIVLKVGKWRKPVRVVGRR